MHCHWNILASLALTVEVLTAKILVEPDEASVGMHEWPGSWFGTSESAVGTAECCRRL